ncbi:hypothetical protein RFI_03969 [Reticulomyxa filosa]|uniref:Uncharacterized protein n=1 Tax=Reticulomyxa filosa TaxID=46433 RepID=X6P4Y0_RETFI|nr:hypothetical protein RFI_03969 [Reticulomyxa filosa]|eukprot:ETO33139.1 hypothetical protein RFI_03969 [Reticulomyxa filosa]
MESKNKTENENIKMETVLELQSFEIVTQSGSSNVQDSSKMEDMKLDQENDRAHFKIISNRSIKVGRGSYKILSSYCPWMNSNVDNNNNNNNNDAALVLVACCSDQGPNVIDCYALTKNSDDDRSGHHCGQIAIPQRSFHKSSSLLITSHICYETHPNSVSTLDKIDDTAKHVVLFQSELGDLYRIQLRGDSRDKAKATENVDNKLKQTEKIVKLTLEALDTWPIANQLVWLSSYRCLLLASECASNHLVLQQLTPNDDISQWLKDRRVETTLAICTWSRDNSTLVDHTNVVYFEPKSNEQCFTVVQTLSNAAPLLRLEIEDLLSEGSKQIYALCGKSQNSKLQILRQGIGLEEMGKVSFNQHQVSRIWTIKPQLPNNDNALLLCISTSMNYSNVQRRDPNMLGSMARPFTALFDISGMYPSSTSEESKNDNNNNNNNEEEEKEEEEEEKSNISMTEIVNSPIDNQVYTIDITTLYAPNVMTNARKRKKNRYRKCQQNTSDMKCSI